MAEIENFLAKNSDWETVKQVIYQFHQEGFEAVLAGGGVRDALLRKKPKDFDLAVSASPEEVLKIFPKGKDLWKKYGVVFLPFSEKKHLEITTFRKESGYSDGRRPNSVEYTDMEEDAKRRDFTVNALFYDLKSKKILDFVGGLKDLESQTLRTVGSPEKRFEEDKLRPLRAIRFSHQLNFSIDENTKKAISSFVGFVETLSQERIYNELLKMFTCGRLNEACSLLKEYGFFHILFPSHIKPVGDPYVFWRNEFSFYNDPSFIWAVLSLPYYYPSEEGLELFLKNLGCSKSVLRKSIRYFKSVKALHTSTSFFDKLHAFTVGKQEVRELAQFFSEAYNKPCEFKKWFEEFEKQEQEGGELPSPLVKGDDLKDFFSGKEIGDVLKKAYNFQLENRISDKNEVMEYLKKFLKK